MGTLIAAALWLAVAVGVRAQTPSLADALDNTTLAFASMGGDWTAQSAIKYSGAYAAQSAVITHSQSTSLTTTVTGPGLLRFHWKVSSESGYDFLRLYVDNVDQGGGISGEAGWMQRTVPISAGAHQIRWTYSKDSSVSANSDAAWVDKVEFIAFTPGVGVLSIAASDMHTLAIRSDGTLWAWGNNNDGRLGDGTTVMRTAPVQIGTDTNWATVSSFYRHSMALKRDGTLWGWGYNGNGQLGNGTLTSRSQPGQVGTATDWISVAAGADHTVAIKSNGTLWAWGANAYGQLGDGTTTQRTSPVQIGSATNWSAIAAGNGHTVGLKADGSLWAWGYNASGQVGNGTLTNVYSPVQIGSNKDWVAIAAGGLYTLALKANGTLWAWGANHYGQLGDGSITARSSPAQIGTASDWISVDAGYAFALAVKSDGSLWAWGYNYFGQLGDGTNSDRYVPQQVGTATGYWLANGGGYHTAALRTDGSLSLWGRNTSGQIGDGTPSSRITAAQIGSATDWTSLAVGDRHMVAVRGDGTLWAWGSGYEGQLGTGTTQVQGVPTQIGSALSWSTVAAGWDHTLAITADGRLFSWGANDYGQLGNGTSGTVRTTMPTQVGTANNWRAVAAGYGFSIASKNDGTLWAWGAATNGRLGLGTTITTPRTTPTQVGSGSDWQSVAAGAYHVLALKTNGELWAWGYNYYGQVGNGGTTDVWSPVRIGADFWSAVSAGGYHSMAVRAGGTLWTWGHNQYGQLGNNGAPTQSTLPIQIGSATTWTGVAAGNYHSLARQADGTLWAWGSNLTGPIGDGSTTQRNEPVRSGTATNWTVIAARGHSAALKSDGTLWTWGWDAYGQLGDGGGNEAVYAPLAVSIGRSFQLSITRSGNGVVSSNPTGIACGATCSVPFTENASVTLLATPSAGESFLGWGGACSGTGTCVVTLDGDKAVTASFSDGMPDAMVFAEQRDVARSAVVTSGAITISGLGASAQISVAGGEYSIGCTATFASSSSTVSNGDTVCVRHTAAADYSTATDTVLTVGFGQAVFRSVTMAAPDAVPDPFRATLLYVPNPDADNVAVVDPAAGAIVQTIAVGKRPVSVLASPDGSRVYVANRGGNTVSVIDTASNRVISHIGAGVEPLSLAMSANGANLYMGSLGCLNQSWLYGGETATGTVGSALPISFPPYQIAADPNGQYLYAAGADLGCNLRLAIVRTQDFSLVREDIVLKNGMTMMNQPTEAAVRNDWGPKGMAVKRDAAGATVYVSSAAGVRAYAVPSDPAAAIGAITTIQAANDLRGAALHPDGSKLYTVDRWNDKLIVINTATNAAETPVSVTDQPTHVALNRDGTRIYILSHLTGVLETRDATQSSYPLLSSTTNLVTNEEVNGQFAVTLNTGFVPKQAAAPGAETDSNAITVSGINQPVPVNLDAGSYRIGNEASWTAAGTERTVNNGDQVQVRLTASSQADTTMTATLTVGDKQVPFSVTTPYAGPVVAPTVPAKWTVHSSAPLGSMQISKDINMADYVPAGQTVNFSIDGGEYSKNGGPFTNAPGTTTSSDRFVLRGAAPTAVDEVAYVILTVGRQAVMFGVQASTAPEADVEPTAFSFTAVSNATPNQAQTSNTITVQGLDGQNKTGGLLRAPISVTGGRYSVNGSAFRSDASFVQNGDSVVAEHTPTAYGTSSSATVTIGATAQGVPVSSEFAVTTIGNALSAIAISGPAEVNEGGTATYVATASYQNGATQTVVASWSLTGTAATIGGTTGVLAAGTVTADTLVTVTANYTEGGVTKTASQAVTVKNSVNVLTGLTISGPAQVNEGGTATYAATASYDNGTTTSVTASWTLTGMAATIAATTGALTASTVTADAQVTVQASYTEGGVTKTASQAVTVKNSVDVLTALSISGPVQINEGGTATYIATATYDNGATQAVTASWSITGTGATIAGGTGALTAGTVTADAQVTVQASYTESGVTKTASQAVTVKNSVNVLTGLTISGPAQVNEGGTATYAATASYDNGTTQSVTATWLLTGTAATIAAATGALTAGTVTADAQVTVQASYTEGGVTKTASQAVTVKDTLDAEPPVITSALRVASVSHDRAIVEWQTSEPTTATVLLGPSTALGGVVNVTQPASTHQVTLSGLSAQTRYYVKVQASDSAGNGPVQSEMIDFFTTATPDATAPVFVRGPLVVDRSDTSLTLELATDEPATARVTVTSASGTSTVEFGDILGERIAKLTGLASSTQYSVRVGVIDALGNGPRWSEALSVTTRQTPDTAAPVFIEAVRVCQVAQREAAICWKTDEPASATVEFGLAGQALERVVVRDEANARHNVPLVGLVTDTGYDFRVRLRDAAGNERLSTIGSLRTQAAPDTLAPVFVVAPFVLYAAGDRVVVEWETDEPTDSVVEYGPSAERMLRASEPGRRKRHQVVLTGLVPSTEYFLRVIATDAAGNRSSAELQ